MCLVSVAVWTARLRGRPQNSVPRPAASPLIRLLRVKKNEKSQSQCQLPPPPPSPEDSSEVSTHILYLKELKPNEMKSPTKKSRKKQICERRIRTRCRARRALEGLSSLNLIGRSHPNKSRLSRTAELSSVLPGGDTLGTASQSNRSTGRLCNDR